MTKNLTAGIGLQDNDEGQSVELVPYPSTLLLAGLDMESDTPRPRHPVKLGVSIATILLATGLAALAAAPYSWLGANYAASAVASLILLAIVCGILAYRRTLLVFLPCLLAVLPAAVLLSSGLFYQAIGTVVVCLATIGVPQWVRLRVGACVVVMLIAYVPAFQYAKASDARIDRMRAAYPLVSIRDRLPERTNDTSEPLTLSEEQEAAVAEIEHARYWRTFASQLERIHNDAHKQFARTPNFGMLRMGPVTQDQMGLEYGFTVGRPYKLPQRLGVEANNASPHELHKSTRTIFLDQGRLGYFKDIDNVAGFVGHGFNQLPYDDQRSRDGDRTGRWRIHRLDLIGLVTHDHPVAYVSENLPNMEELGGAPTRELDEFETQALEQLRQEKDIVFEEQAGGDSSRLVMVGALRAGKSCATCHSVPYGTLLGAFSYELQRESHAATPLQSRPSAAD